MKKDKTDSTISKENDHLSKDEIIEMALLKNISGGISCTGSASIDTCGTRQGGEGDNSCWHDTCYKVITFDIP